MARKAAFELDHSRWKYSWIYTLSSSGTWSASAPYRPSVRTGDATARTPIVASLSEPPFTDPLVVPVFQYGESTLQPRIISMLCPARREVRIARLALASRKLSQSGTRRPSGIFLARLSPGFKHDLVTERHVFVSLVRKSLTCLLSRFSPNTWIHLV